MERSALKLPGGYINLNGAMTQRSSSFKHYWQPKIRIWNQMKGNQSLPKILHLIFNLENNKIKISNKKGL